MTETGAASCSRGHRAHGHNLPLKGQAMTGEKNTNRACARKGARVQSQTTPPAARPKVPADRPQTGGRPPLEQAAPQHAAEGRAPSPERAGPFLLELPLALGFVTARDPAEQPDHRLRAGAAVHGLEICESLFWAMQQIGRMATGGGWVYRESDLYEALDNLGELGKAVASGAGEQVQRLEQIADGLSAGRGVDDGVREA